MHSTDASLSLEYVFPNTIESFTLYQYLASLIIRNLISNVIKGSKILQYLTLLYSTMKILII